MFTLALPPGYRADDMLAYHGRDPLSLSERVEGATLVKAMTVEGRAVVLEMAFRRGAVHCRVPGPGLAPGPRPWPGAPAGGADAGAGHRPGGLRAVRGGHDLQPLVAQRPGLRIPLTADVWESLVWAILGQQVNLAFAYALRRRLTELCGEDTGRGCGPTPPRGGGGPGARAT